MATVKQLEETVKELQEQVATLSQQMAMFVTLNTRVTQMGDVLVEIEKIQTDSNDRIQSDIRRIVDRMSTSPTRLL